MQTATKDKVRGGFQHPAARRTAEHVHAHLADSLSTSQMARVVGLSTQQFCRVIKKEFGVTFMEYLIRARIHTAIELFQDPYVRVKEVAKQVGFASVPYFNRKFRQYTGMSPRQHRAKIGQENAKIVQVSVLASSIASVQTVDPFLGESDARRPVG